MVLQSYQGGTFHIWLMKPDGTGLRQLTTGHGDDREPRISPDGKTIAFASDRAFKGSYDIWTVDAGSGALKQITTSENDEYEPAWSPDGKQIAYVNGVFVAGPAGVGGVQGRTIEAIDLATGATHVLASTKGVPGRLESPSWSADGKKLAYVQMFGAGNFVDSSKMMVDGNVVSDKDDDTFPFPARWLSPTSLLYTANGKIVKADLAAKTEVAIPFTADIQSIRPVYPTKNFEFDSTAVKQVKGILAPALSPDGRSIAFVALNELYASGGGKERSQSSDTRLLLQAGPGVVAGWEVAGVCVGQGWDREYLSAEPGYRRGEGAGTVADDGGDISGVVSRWKEDGVSEPDRRDCDAGSGDGGDFAACSGDVLSGAARFLDERKDRGDCYGEALFASVPRRDERDSCGGCGYEEDEWYEPAPFESISTRTEDGPVYSPDGKEMVFVMDDLLYTMPVDADGRPSGKAML